MKEPPGAGEPVEDEALDELLLLLVEGADEAVGEVFRERRRRWAGAVEARPEGAIHEAPRRRDDEGTALRLVLPEAVRGGHVSGAGGEALRELARSLARGAAPPPGPLPEPAEPPREPGGLAARRLEEAAAFLVDAAGSEASLLRARASLQREERLVHCLSSEWGHALDRRESWRLELELELERDGARSRAARGCGWSGETPSRAFGGLVDELFEAARTGLEAEAAPAGSPPVVLAAGGGAVLFHEAVGHALEADVVERAGTVLSGRQGEPIAPEFVSVLDDASRPDAPARAACDDEGVPVRRLALVERGRVGEPLRDGLRGGFEAERLTGHGRRASHRAQPLPRMWSTWVEAGEHDRDELLRRAGDGLLVERLERGAFDPATGAFRLRVAEARRLEGGRPGRALRPFWLEGDTLHLLSGIEALGGDLAWDDGCGTCGRDGQWLPVAAGCPTVLLREGTLRVG